jgi:hypothetical protein
MPPKKNPSCNILICPALNLLFSNFPLLYVYCSLTWHCRYRTECFIQDLQWLFPWQVFCTTAAHECSTQTPTPALHERHRTTGLQSDVAVSIRRCSTAIGLCYQAGTSLTGITHTNRLFPNPYGFYNPVRIHGMKINYMIWYNAHLWSLVGCLCLGSSVFSKFHQAILSHHRLSCQDCLDHHPNTNIKHQCPVTAESFLRSWQLLTRNSLHVMQPHRIGTGGGRLRVRWGTFKFHKCGEFLD